MDFDHPPAHPLPELQQWLADARTTDLPNPHAMTLATVDPAGIPSTRTVLLKALDERGAVFFTNCDSRKGTALAANPRAALLLHWDALTRQVIIEGVVTEVDGTQSDEYFASRPRASQIGAWASRQSRPVADRAALDAAAAEIERRFEGREIPRPPHWGGYRVSLDRIEFWQGHPFRLHDRVVYLTDEAGGWTVQRLQP
jgi:pyridoxamine 5'-phosphate oxidase